MFQYILRSLDTFLIRNYFYSNAKKYKYDKKKQNKFWSDSRFINWKISKYFNQILNWYFSTYYQNWAQTTNLKPYQTLFDKTYSDLTSFFWSKNIKVFQWLWSKLLSFMSKVNPNHGNETKSDIFPRDIFKSDVISFFTKI